jgi:hypothetical protein
MDPHVQVAARSLFNKAPEVLFVSSFLLSQRIALTFVAAYSCGVDLLRLFSGILQLPQDRRR